jgi:NAD(P)-dependent dehydrogenase (short-subunit alcohol dehydrogenase family)
MAPCTRVALVTGASRGIGQVISAQLAKGGYRVAAGARSLPVDGAVVGGIASAACQPTVESEA